MLQGAISAAAPAATSLAGLGSGGLSALPLGSIIGAGMSGLGMVANALSSRKAYKRQRALMELQAQLNYDYNRKQTLNQYGWMRKGLSSADYNPLLAVQGASATSQSWAGSPASPQADFTGMVGDFSNATDKIMSQQMFKSNIDNLISQTSLNNSNVRLNTEKGLNLMADTDLKTTENEIQKIEKDHRSSLLDSQVYKNLVSARSDLLNAVANQTSANASQISANAQRIKADSDVRLQNQTIEKFKSEMKLTEQQTENMRQIYKWYGYEKGTQIILQLAMSGYFGTGSVKNMAGALHEVTGAAGDVTSILGNFAVPGNPVGFRP
jgi:hypothetical protein